MLDVVCCGHDTAKITNIERLWGYRNSGLSEDESQAKALVGFFCDTCGNWHRITGDNLIHDQAGKVE